MEFTIPSRTKRSRMHFSIYSFSAKVYNDEKIDDHDLVWIAGRSQDSNLHDLLIRRLPVRRGPTKHVTAPLLSVVQYCLCDHSYFNFTWWMNVTNTYAYFDTLFESSGERDLMIRSVSVLWAFWRSYDSLSWKYVDVSPIKKRFKLKFRFWVVKDKTSQSLWNKDVL